METTINGKAVVQNYFNAFQQGDMKAVLDTFHENCLIVSVRDAKRDETTLHGTYRGKEAAAQFLANIVNLFDTNEFVVEEMMSEENRVFSRGSFSHTVKTTGQLFLSDWVQWCQIKDGKIMEYRFYEDSAAFVVASQKQ